MLSWIYREGGGVVSMDTIGKSGGKCSPGYMEGRRRGSFHGYRKEEGGYSPGYREGGRRDSFSNSIKVIYGLNLYDGETMMANSFEIKQAL